MGRSVHTDTLGLIPNRACRNCVQIKVKCIPVQGSTDNVCQRCHRLGKDCTTPAPVVRKQRLKSTRVTQLEERVNELTALLTPTQASETRTRVVSQPSRSQTGLPLTPKDSSVQSTPQDECSTFANDAHQVDALGTQSVPRAGSPFVIFPPLPDRKDGSQLLNEYFCPVYLDPELEAKLFGDFRTNMLKQLPCVVIRASIAAEAFKKERPFSYWAGIYVASYRNRQLHRTLHDEMMKALGHRMLVAGSKNMDLLQGLLVLIGWHHYISHYNPQLMNLLHLVQALLTDMGIIRPVRTQDKFKIASDTSGFMHGVESTAITITADERRALLGCYTISSKAALAFNRMDPMRYSQHIDDCCKTLRLASEYESDLLLVELVQLHRIFGKYLQVDSLSATSSKAYRTMLQDEIEQYKTNVPPMLRGDPMLELEILSCSLCFLEPPYALNGHDKIDHLNALHTCLNVGNRLVDALTSIPSRDWPNGTCFITMSMVQLSVVFSRLSFFKCDSSDVQYAWRIVNFGALLQRLADMFEGVHQHEAETYQNYQPWRFAIYARKVQHIKAWYEAKVAAEEAALASNADDIMPNTFSETMFGNFDDSVWQDLMGNWTDF